MARSPKPGRRRRTSSRRGQRRWLLPKLLLVLAVPLLFGLVWLDAQVRHGLAERAWQVPAQVYARPLTLYPGQPLAAADLRHELGLLGYRVVRSVQGPGEVRATGDGFEVHSRGFVFADEAQLPGRWWVRFHNNSVSALHAADGTPLEMVRLEPVALGSVHTRHQEDRMPVRLEEVPPLLVQTLLLVEDRDFYRHFGVSPRGIARAALANLRARRTVQGGSTLTQQLVKNALLSQERSIWRKGLEGVMAPLVELHHDKDAILELYINEVYLGQEGPRAIHGFALAARHYFNRPLQELAPEQMALLVGMIRGPSLYHPWRHPQRALARRDLVLGLMGEHGLLSPTELAAARGRDLGLASASAGAGVYPAYLDLVRRQLRRDYRDADLATQGLRIFTAFDPLVQRHAEESLAQILRGLGPERAALEAAVVVTDVVSGDVLALIGGRRMRFAGFNRALDAVRPIGSLVKPVVYLEALSRPTEYTLVSSVLDAPVTVAGADGSRWEPRNFDRRSHGEVPLHQALSQSYNQATVRLGMQLGLPAVLNTAERLGRHRDWPAVPAMLIGAAELSPLEVAVMYQTLAAHGVATHLRAIHSIADANGEPLARYPQRPRQALPPGPVHLMHYALQEVVREGTGRGVYQRLPADYRVAGKTGSTDDFRDSWFAGFAGDYLAVVWLGHDDNRPTGLSGSAGALRVWAEFMARASRVPMPFDIPEGVVYHWVDADGRLSAEDCEGARYVPFLDGSAPVVRGACLEAPARRLRRWFQQLF